MGIALASVLVTTSLGGVCPAYAQESDSTTKTAEASPAPPAPTISAPQAVRRGNRLLQSGNASGALRQYRQAQEAAPDSREVAFVEGLAHYDLKEYDKAREAFERAGPFEDDALADDALYSLGVSDHAEALAQMEANPQASVGLLESAMQRYRDVLSRRQDHEYARDANFKAASMWRKLKAMMQQQPQQQQSSGENEDSEEKEQQSSENQDSESQQQQDDSDSAEKQQSAQQQEQEGEKQDEQQVSQEQAERRLREMMQAIRDKSKRKRRQTQPVMVRPVDKDW